MDMDVEHKCDVGVVVRGKDCCIPTADIDCVTLVKDSFIPTAGIGTRAASSSTVVPLALVNDVVSQGPPAYSRAPGVPKGP